MTFEKILALPAGDELDSLIASKIMDLDINPVPFYSTDLNSAWELLTSQHSKFLHFRCLSSRLGHDFRLCRGYPNQDIYYVYYMTPGGHRGGPNANTMPLAICRAAIQCCLEGKI